MRKTFNIWLEDKDEMENLKGVVFTALFSELDPLEADANLDLKFHTLDGVKIRDMLQNMKIITAMHGRDPQPIIKNGSIRDFLDWLVDDKESQGTE